jgi:hypothetical protein
VLVEDRAECVDVANVDVVERNGTPCQRLDPLEALQVRVAQVVHHNDLVPRREQLEHRVAPDVADAPSHEHPVLVRASPQPQGPCDAQASCQRRSQSSEQQRRKAPHRGLVKQA